jgi:DNA-binding MarR family transcriptional regulator
MTSLLDTLERRGLVTRLPDPDDRRKILVTLTESGARLVDDFLPEMIAVQTAVMAGLSEADRRQLQRSLASIRRAIAAIDVDAVAAAAPERGVPRQG